MKQNVLITWASRGLGYELSLQLLASGAYNVYGTATSSKWIEVMEKDGIEPYLCDLWLPESIKSVVSTVGRKVDNLDFLVNNAWIRSKVNLSEMTDEHIQEVFSTNIIGHMIATRESLRYMDTWNIVFMNSTAGLVPSGWSSGYVTTKYAMTGFADSMRDELQHRVWVSSVFLWGMNTWFHSVTRDQLMNPKDVAEKIFKNIFENTQRWTLQSLDLKILSSSDRGTQVGREMIIEEM